jgi:uncharacterized protein YnzC (UPF0291/DUF896 family)
MAVVKTFNPANRLAQILEGSEGVSFEEMVAASEVRVEDLLPGLRESVREKINAITVIHDEGEDSLFARSQEVGDLAMNIAEVAGAARLPALGEVARGICAMIESLLSAGVWHTDGLNLHIMSLTLLSAGKPLPADEVRKMLKQLREMRRAIGVLE